MLPLLEGFTIKNGDRVAMDIANDFRKRRIEKNITRQMIARKAEVPLASVVRFEQKGLISLKSLISLAMALGYTSEILHIFSTPKYATMEEMMQIKRNSGKKKAYRLPDIDENLQ